MPSRRRRGTAKEYRLRKTQGTDWNQEDEFKSKREWYEENPRNGSRIHLDKVLREGTIGIERKQTERKTIYKT